MTLLGRSIGLSCHMCGISLATKRNAKKKLCGEVENVVWEREYSCSSKWVIGERETSPNTRLPKSRAGGQKPFFRSLDHLGRRSEVKE